MKILVSEDLWNFDLEQALQQISAQRREQALKFKFELGQRQCVLSYLLLKQLLAEVFGYRENPVFEFGEHGKPAIVGHPEMFFNMSHCREAVACVVAHQAVGIDVEAVREYTPSLLNYVMSADEQAQIAAAERQDLAFISLWTKKEAVLKLTGEGLRDNVRTVLEECTMQNAECTMQNAECTMLSTTVSENQRYVYTVAYWKEDGRGKM
jgi:4'-phosphopantetheinyl transferase